MSCMQVDSQTVIIIIHVMQALCSSYSKDYCIILILLFVVPGLQPLDSSAKMNQDRLSSLKK